MNISTMEISFWRHKINAQGKVKLYCRISVAGERVDIGSTGLSIYYDYWNGEHISDKDPEAFFKNEQLDIMRNQLRATFNDLFRKKEKITAAKIKRAFLGQSTTVTLLSAFALYMKDSQKDQERKLTAATLNVYDNVRKKLTTFLISEKATDLLLEDFDITWVKKFRQWMKTVPLPDGKVGHADSYVVKQTQTIKNVLIWAKLHKLADSNPLEGLRIKGIEWDDPVFLTEEEFQRLRAYPFKNRRFQETADVFIILCRSGFHYGDLVDFVKKYRTAIKQGLDGQPWIVKDRIKTEVKIHVPVFEEVQQVVDKYGGWENLPIRPPQRFNLYLKNVADEVGLHEELSSKAGRKTFTDWCFNKLMLSTDAVKVVLGRKSAAGLHVYGRPDERRVISELEKSKEMQKRRKKKR
jgi:hypothetical protein